MKSFVVFVSVLAVGFCKYGNATQPVEAAATVPAVDAIKCKLDLNKADGALPTSDWVDLKYDCFKLARQQIQMEFRAALAYLQLGAYFNQYDVNRPGFAQLFFSAASEERSHAIKIFDYLLMRGNFTTWEETNPGLHTLLEVNANPDKTETERVSDSLAEKLQGGKVDGLGGLDLALTLEVLVTKSIKNMIKVCEDDKQVNAFDGDDVAANDYHMVDWLITDLLDEQLKGQRELAGRITTLQKMKQGYGQIADFLYDKELLKELNAATA